MTRRTFADLLGAHGCGVAPVAPAGSRATVPPPSAGPVPAQKAAEPKGEPRDEPESTEGDDLVERDDQGRLRLRSDEAVYHKDSDIRVSPLNLAHAGVDQTAAPDRPTGKALDLEAVKLAETEWVVVEAVSRPVPNELMFERPPLIDGHQRVTPSGEARIPATLDVREELGVSSSRPEPPAS